MDNSNGIGGDPPLLSPEKLALRERLTKNLIPTPKGESSRNRKYKKGERGLNSIKEAIKEKLTKHKSRKIINVLLKGFDEDKHGNLDIKRIELFISLMRMLKDTTLEINNNTVNNTLNNTTNSGAIDEGLLKAAQDFYSNPAPEVKPHRPISPLNPFLIEAKEIQAQVERENEQSNNNEQSGSGE